MSAKTQTKDALRRLDRDRESNARRGLNSILVCPLVQPVAATTGMTTVLCRVSQLAPSPERAYINLSVVGTNLSSHRDQPRAVMATDDLKQYGMAVSKMKPNCDHAEMSPSRRLA